MSARSLVREFLSDENGATAVEYSLIAAGIAVAIAGAVMFLGSNVTGSFNNVNNAM
ncbi:MAG: Flp family type IVb pilin [Rhizobiales bacterium]|nr:Flp family type IVb pilin [Hyphomicrobiales bacterium]